VFPTLAGLVTYWEIIADKLSADGWTVGWVKSITASGTTVAVDAHRGDGKRYIVRADQMLTAFLELESACSKATPQDS
jgi:hypothetical protein